MPPVRRSKRGSAAAVPQSQPTTDDAPAAFSFPPFPVIPDKPPPPFQLDTKTIIDGLYERMKQDGLLPITHQGASQQPVIINTATETAIPASSSVPTPGTSQELSPSEAQLHLVNQSLASMVNPDVVSLVISSSAWNQCLLLSLVVMLVAVTNTQHYTVHPDCPSNRVESFFWLLSPLRLVHVTVCACCGGAMAWLYTRLMSSDSPYQHLTRTCSSPQQLGGMCLNEYHLFLVLHAVFTGALFSVLHFLHTKHQLDFPIIQQSKFFQVKSRLLGMCVSSLIQSLKHAIYFFLIYYILLGQAVKSKMSTSLGIYEDVNTTPVNSIWGMLDLGLLWNSCFSAALVHLLCSLPALLYTVYHTEHFTFPIDTPLEEYKDKCLHNALTSTSLPLLQYLGYQDLCLLAQHSPSRRKQLFSLTQLGGHPLNWSRVSTECISQLKHLTEAVSAFNMEVLAKGSMRHGSGETYKHTWNGNAVTTLTHRSATQSSTDNATDTGKQTPAEGFVAKLLKIKPLAFLDKQCGHCSRKLFAESQKHMWAASALSYLVCASFKEDTYGVVQKSLQTIIREMLTLLEALDRHMKLGVTPGLKSNGRSSSRNGTSGNEFNRKLALRAALKSGLYRISTTFQQHLDTLSLTGEEKRRLHLFMDYKE